MALLIVGTILIALGLFSGSALVLVPLGLAPFDAGLMLWIVFPLFSLGGYLLFITGARVNHIRQLTVLVSTLLLLLAVGSAVAIVLASASLLHPVGSTLSLWYVMLIAGALGALSAAAHGKSDPAKAMPAAP